MQTEETDLRLARRMRRVTASAIMELLKATAQGNYISFASGLPDPTLFPATALTEISEEVLREDGQRALQYGPAEGHPPLRAWVAERLRKRGLADATPEHILITQGSQQALDLAARAFLDTGERVLVETPSYLAAIQAFDSYEAEYAAAPLDSEGIDVERAAAHIQTAPPRLIFTLPNYQNPTGITQSLARRQRLAELAAANRIPLLEDDAYHDLRYEGEPLPPVTALAPNPMAVYTGTFSKVIAPGLRVGYLYAQPPLVARLTQLKQITDLHTGSFTQRLVLRFCERGLLEPQIALQCETYRARRDALIGALASTLNGTVQRTGNRKQGTESITQLPNYPITQLPNYPITQLPNHPITQLPNTQHPTPNAPPGLATWTRPLGGMFLFVTLPPALNAAALLPEAMRRGIVYVPGAGFHPDGGGTNTLRLNFVSASPDSIRRGISILAELLTAANERLL